VGAEEWIAGSDRKEWCLGRGARLTAKIVGKDNERHSGWRVKKENNEVPRKNTRKYLLNPHKKPTKNGM